jgi:hypothetical protein
VIVAKWADHQPLHRQEKMFERHGIEISRKTMGGWMAQCAELLDPLYQYAVGDAHQPVIVYDYPPPDRAPVRRSFWKDTKGIWGGLQADAYSVYDAFFKSERGMT